MRWNSVHLRDPSCKGSCISLPPLEAFLCANTEVLFVKLVMLQVVCSVLQGEHTQRGKKTLIVFICVQNMSLGPQYLAECLLPIRSARPVRSSQAGRLRVLTPREAHKQ